MQIIASITNRNAAQPLNACLQPLSFKAKPDAVISTIFSYSFFKLFRLQVKNAGFLRDKSIRKD